jgi:hypothetical protein
VSDASSKLRLLDRKADFTLSFFHMPSPGFEDLYGRLRAADNFVVSHMADVFTKTTALFSCVELVDKSGLVEPCFAIVGHETHVYFANIASEERDTVNILGPEVGSLGLCETRSVSGIFRALRLWRNVIRYRRDGGGEGCWGSFMGVVLQRLVGDMDEEYGAPLASTAQSSEAGVGI